MYEMVLGMHKKKMKRNGFTGTILRASGSRSFQRTCKSNYHRCLITFWTNKMTTFNQWSPFHCMSGQRRKKNKASSSTTVAAGL